MQITLPKFKLKDTIYWQNAADGDIGMGDVQGISITLAVDKDPAVFYHVNSDAGEMKVVREGETLNMSTLKTPKYKLGDCILFVNVNAENDEYDDVGIISKIEVTTEPDYTEVVYFVGDDHKNFVYEQDILGLTTHATMMPEDEE